MCTKRSTALITLTSIGLLMVQPASAQLRLLDASSIPARVLDVDRQTGDGSVLASLQAFSNIQDITTAPLGDLLTLYSFPTASLVSIDPASGSQLLLSSGGLFAQPTRVDRGSSGQIVVLDIMDDDRLIEVDATTGQQTERPLLSPLGSVVDLVVEASGDVLVFDTAPSAGSAAIIRVSATTGLQTVLSSSGYLSFGMGGALHLDGADGLYVRVDAFPSQIIRIDLSSGEQRLVASGGFLAASMSSGGIEVDGNGDLLATGGGGTMAGVVVRVDPLLGIQIPIASGGFLTQVRAIVLSGGFLYSGTSPFSSLDPTVVELDLDTGGQRSVVTSPMLFPGDLAAMSGGDIFVSGSGGILRVDPMDGSISVLSAGGFLSFVSDIVADPVSGDLFVRANVGTDASIIRIDEVLGSQLPVAVGGLLQSATMNGLAVSPGGQVFLLADSGGPIAVQVDVDTGAQTLLPGGGLLAAPVDLTVGGLSGDLFILDSTAAGGGAGIIRKNPVTGAETLVPTGAFASPPLRIAADDSDTLYVTASSMSAPVLKVDPITGVQTPFAVSGLFSGFGDIDACPEPSSSGMQASCFAMIVMLGAWRRSRARITRACG